MAYIQEFLKQNPSLADKDPVKLAGFVYDTQMKAKGVDRVKFEEFFLGAPVEKQSFLGPEYGDGFLAKNSKALARKAVDAFKGDAEFPELGNYRDAKVGGLGDIMGEDMTAMAPITLDRAALLGNDEDIMNAIKEVAPDAQFQPDANGNMMFKLPDGREGYINTPGLDSEDFRRFIAKGMAFIPAAKAAQKVQQAGTAVRTLVGGLGAAGTDMAMQVGSGRDEIDPQQTLVTAALGGAGEAVAPAVANVVHAARKSFGAARWAAASDTTRMALIRRQMRADGIDPDEIQGLSQEQLMNLGRRRYIDNRGESVTSAIADEEFGFRQTRGQAMPDTTETERVLKTDQLNREEFWRSSGGYAGQKLQDNLDQNVEKIGENVQNLVGEMSGGTAQGQTRNQSAQRAQEALIRARERSEARYSAKYNEASQYEGEFADEVMLGLPERVRDRLNRENVILDDLGSPAGSQTRGALVLLREITENPQTTVKAIENQRQKINRWISGNKPGSRNYVDQDFRAMTILKDEYDDALSEAIEVGMYSGDPRAFTVLQEARGLYAEHAKKFNTNTKAGKVVQELLEVPPEDVAKYVFGSTGVSKDGAARVVKHYKKAVGGEGSEGWNALRETYLHSITSVRSGDPKGLQAMVSTLKDAINNNGESVVKALYTPTEVAKLKRFVKAMDNVTLKGDRARTSGTAERLMRVMGSSAFGDIPGIDMLRGLARSIEAGAALRNPAPPLSVLPATGAYSTSQ